MKIQESRPSPEDSLMRYNNSKRRGKACPVGYFIPRRTGLI